MWAGKDCGMPVRETGWSVRLRKCSRTCLCVCVCVKGQVCASSQSSLNSPANSSGLETNRDNLGLTQLQANLPLSPPPSISNFQSKVPKNKLWNHLSYSSSNALFHKLLHVTELIQIPFAKRQIYVWEGGCGLTPQVFTPAEQFFYPQSKRGTPDWISVTRCCF